MRSVLEMDALDCLDSSIVLGTIFEEDEQCDTFINVLGYKMRNKGLLTQLIIGEIFTNLFLKVSTKVNDPFQRKLAI